MHCWRFSDARRKEEGTSEQGVLLLKDIQLLFASQSADRLASQLIVEELNKMEERPWPEMNRGAPMTATQLARLLKPFGIEPTTLRHNGGSPVKGYYKEAFEESWKRYLNDPDIHPG